MGTQGKSRKTSDSEQPKATMPITPAPYCNLLKGPHNNECRTPSQCYCICHSDKGQTDNKLKSERTYCQNRIKAINKILAERQERVSDMITNNQEAK